MSDPLMAVEILERIHEFSVRGANGELTEEDWNAFEQLLRENDDACRMYGQYVDVSALLPAILSSLSAETAPSTDVAFPEPLEPARLPALPLLGAFWHGAIGFFSQEIPFALLVGTVITSLGLLAGSMVYVTHSRQSASNAPRPIPSAGSDQKITPSDIEFVGRVTGMVDVRWADINTSTELGNHVFLGRKFKLSSGLMEITYNTGAKVILQGPVTYQVDSLAGGFLSLGRLTARVEKRRGGRGESSGEVASGQWSVAGETDQKSLIPNPQSPAPRPQSLVPMFAVRTPTATVTDLGTEFGVAVDKSGSVTTHVFHGKVEVQVADSEEPRPILLGENDSVCVDATKGAAVVVEHTSAVSNTFVRCLPKLEQVSLKLFNTGMGLKEGQPDPHWQIVAVSNDPSFQACPAMVSPAAGQWLPNEVGPSQWISLVGDLSDLPHNVVYTFSTSFELPAGARPNSARLTGRFFVDNHVRAIRLNGHKTLLPEHGYQQFILVHRFSIAQGFVAGTNVLEVEVENGFAPKEGEATPANGGEHSPMALRMEFEGSVLRCVAPAEDLETKQLSKGGSKE